METTQTITIVTILPVGTFLVGCLISWLLTKKFIKPKEVIKEVTKEVVKYVEVTPDYEVDQFQVFEVLPDSRVYAWDYFNKTAVYTKQYEGTTLKNGDNVKYKHQKGVYVDVEIFKTNL